MKKRVFKQPRAEATFEAIVSAAPQVFASKGFDGTQTGDVARAAGISTGAVYQYFTDKRAIFLEVLRRHRVWSRQEVDRRLDLEVFATLSPRDAIGSAIDVLFTVIERHAGLNRVYLALSFTDPEVAKMRAESEAEERTLLAGLIRALVPPDAVPDPDAAATVIQSAALEVAVFRAKLRTRAGAPVNDAALRAALVDMIHRYLFSARSEAAAAPRKRARDGRSTARRGSP